MRPATGLGQTGRSSKQVDGADVKTEEQQFLNELDKKLWTAANKLLPMLDAAVYKHVVLGLIFLKYVSDSFKERRDDLESAFRDPSNDYYLGADANDLIPGELEARDYYLEKNVFWVPALARWEFIQSHAKVPVGTKLQVKNGKTIEYEFKGIGRLLDDALEAVEKENPRLKGVLEKASPGPGQYFKGREKKSEDRAARPAVTSAPFKSASHWAD